VNKASTFADLVNTDIREGKNSAVNAINYTATNCDAARKERDKANEYKNEITKAADAAKNNADAAIDNYNQAVLLANDVNKSVAKLETIDPPIASIGQNVQFIVNYGGNVTPTWNFVRFKGPNSPLFGAQGMRTHILNISLGPTAPATTSGQKGSTTLARGSSTAVQQSQLNLLLTTLAPARPF
jgi:hypothetical protein